MGTAAENQKDLNEKNNSCPPVTLEWFSIQILVNFEIFKRYFWDLQLKIYRLTNFNILFQFVLTKASKAKCWVFTKRPLGDC